MEMPSQFLTRCSIQAIPLLGAAKRLFRTNINNLFLINTYLLIRQTGGNYWYFISWHTWTFCDVMEICDIYCRKILAPIIFSIIYQRWYATYYSYSPLHLHLSSKSTYFESYLSTHRTKTTKTFTLYTFFETKVCLKKVSHHWYYCLFKFKFPRSNGSDHVYFWSVFVLIFKIFVEALRIRKTLWSMVRWVQILVCELYCQGVAATKPHSPNLYGTHNHWPIKIVNRASYLHAFINLIFLRCLFVSSSFH